MARPRLILIAQWLPLPGGGYYKRPAGSLRMDSAHLPVRLGLRALVEPSGILTVWPVYPRSQEA